MDYIEVTKPLPSILLTFIGLCTAIIAGDGQLTPRLLLVIAAIFLTSAGANGLTNYLDRDIDARMQRTRKRVLPSQRISPPQKVLPFLISLVVSGLALAWWLHPFAFLAGLIGTLAAVVWRKRSTCVFPQGILASCAPVLGGWFAIKTVLSWEILFLCILVVVWLPLHVWSVMIAHREDYRQAGLNIFPINHEVREAVKVLLVFSLVLYMVSIALYFAGGFNLLYLAAANILGIIMVYAGIRLVRNGAAADAWKMYKLSSFPYLGVIFTIMCLDIWLLG